MVLLSSSILSILGHSCGVRVLMAVEFIVAGHGLPRQDPWTDMDVLASRVRFRDIVASTDGAKLGVYNPPPFVMDLEGFLTAPPSQSDEFVSPPPILQTIAPDDLMRSSTPIIMLTLLDGTKRCGKIVDFSHRMSKHIVDLEATSDRDAESGLFCLFGEGQVPWLIQQGYLAYRMMSDSQFAG